MPKAKYGKLRQTRAPNGNRKLRKEDGRPKGTHKRFLFEETRLGFFLKYEVPVVYDIIMNLTPKKPFPEPPLLLVRAVCRASKDPSFKKDKFHRYINIYAKEGLFCKRAKRITPERKRYYDALRKKKMEKFIRQNRERIEQLKRITEAINMEEGKK